MAVSPKSVFISYRWRLMTRSTLTHTHTHTRVDNQPRSTKIPKPFVFSTLADQPILPNTAARHSCSYTH